MKPTPPLPPIHLSKLTHLAELFALLNGGCHLNRIANPVLWTELESEISEYESLFGALGYALRIDGRGFAWFQTQEASSTISKSTRQLALMFMLLFEQQANAGQHLGRFTDWRIDHPLLTAIFEKNQLLLEAEGFAEVDLLQPLLDTAVRYGFAETIASGWRLLPAVFRYLDRFEELAASSNQADAVISDVLIAEEKEEL